MARYEKIFVVISAACVVAATAAFVRVALPAGGPQDTPASENAGPPGGPGVFGPFGGPGDFGPPPGMEGFRGRGGRGGFGPPGGFGGGDVKLVEKFDKDGDGRLNREERNAARESLTQEGGRRGGPGFFGSPNGATRRETTATAALLTPDQVPAVAADVGLYDEKTLRTFFLQFEDPDWFEELGDFYHTDVEVPADLIVDGVMYPSVGVHFRGNTSYMFTGNSEKKSFNISVDYVHDDQRLDGYRTLNLHNGASDPTFLRDVLFSRISRDYTPALKANFVKLVINGENWGVYSNVQQFNRDFLGDWFGTKDGFRWKISMMGPGGGSGGLTYLGDDPEAYKRAYELKSDNEPEAWAALIDLCKKLDQTAADQVEEVLSPILNIDQVLWAIALENVFIDEGYVTRGADYGLYREGEYGRFGIVSIDNNETFKHAEGPGMGRAVQGVELSPLAFADDNSRPLIHALLSMPALQARYLAHVRTIVDEWLNWETLAPVVAEYQDLIDAEVRADTRKLYSYEAFAKGATEDIETGGMLGGPPGFGGGPPPMFGPGAGPDGGPGPGGGMGPDAGPPTGPPEEFLDAMFKEMDDNGDGRIAGDEIPEMTRELILRDDADGDGAVTREEFGKSFLNGPPGSGLRMQRAGDPRPFGPPGDEPGLERGGRRDFGPRGERGRGGRGMRGGPGGPGGNISLKRFVEERRAFLLAQPELNSPRPAIEEVTCSVSAKGEASPLPTEPVHVQARVGGEAKADAVLLYYAEAQAAPFAHVAMFDDGQHGDGEAGDGLYAADIPAFPAGTQVHYYVEARSSASVGTTTFSPARAEWGALTYRVAMPVAEKSPVVINEVMAANTSTIKDPQGDYDDWIELRNTSDREIDLSGMYLSDKKDNPRKWEIPEGTTLASGARLIVWADEDGKDTPGLHANFKLSKSGEIVMLVDTDERGNARLDSVEFGEQEDDTSWGRLPDGKGDFQALPPTPGEENAGSAGQ